ncbi:hypothetical protein TSAR_001841, partial [Trichomalopsis sarcophagae]
PGVGPSYHRDPVIRQHQPEQPRRVSFSPASRPRQVNQKTGLTTSVRTEGFTFNKQSTIATSILDRKKNYHQGSTTGGHPEE